MKMGREGKDWERTREETPVVKAAKPALDHATRSTRHPEPTHQDRGQGRKAGP